MLAEPWLTPSPHNRVRELSLWILRHASIQANTFPSAHVATATGIATGTFAGRYHFAADVMAGGAVAAMLFLLTW